MVNVTVVEFSPPPPPEPPLLEPPQPAINTNTPLRTDKRIIPRDMGKSFLNPFGLNCETVQPYRYIRIGTAIFPFAAHFYGKCGAKPPHQGAV
jgi:hypothetical protein